MSSSHARSPIEARGELLVEPPVAAQLPASDRAGVGPKVARRSRWRSWSPGTKPAASFAVAVPCPAPSTVDNARAAGRDPEARARRSAASARRDSVDTAAPDEIGHRSNSPSKLAPRYRPGIGRTGDET